MRPIDVHWGRKALVWLSFAALLGIPILVATDSPQLAWRDPIYIVAGFAGIVALALLLAQPVLAGRYLPGLPAGRSRRLHRWTGGALVLSVLVHVVGLWITSPPDVIDALLFASPTAFSVWGVVAMWGVFATAVLVMMYRRLRYRIWRNVHAALGVVIVLGSVVHAVLIDGTMETISKLALCGAVLMATFAAIKVRQGKWGGQQK